MVDYYCVSKCWLCPFLLDFRSSVRAAPLSSFTKTRLGGPSGEDEESRISFDQYCSTIILVLIARQTLYREQEFDGTGSNVLAMVKAQYHP